MSATGYTTIYNEVLRDSTLSLDAKGLFAVIKSFIGLPGFALSKRRLGYACSDSAYLLNAAWKELKHKGYLQHYFSQAENGAFCHVYNLMQYPSEPVDFVYSPSIDSTDPFGPGEGLFTMEFYGNCYKALHEHGVLVNQHESPFYRGDALACQRAHRNIVHSFELSRLFQAHIPTYPSGHWLFGFSSRGVHPVRDLDPDWWNSLGLETGYYNTNLHKGAFYLPNYVQKLLEKVEE